MNNLRLTILRFLVSNTGGLMAPIIAWAVALTVSKVAAFDSGLAGQIDQRAIVGFIMAAILAVVNYATNAAQTSGIKQIQALVNTDQDGIPGPITYTEVRRAIAL